VKTHRWCLYACAMSLGCSTPFEDASTVGGVRILAVQADPDFAHPGDRVSLEALAVDSQGTPLELGWTTCDNPPSSSPIDCFRTIANGARAGRPPEIEKGAGLTGYSFDVPPDALSRLSGAAAQNASIGVVTVACPGAISFGDPASWPTDALPITCKDASGKALPPAGFVVAVKSVLVRHSDRNANPAIADVTWNGAKWPEDQVQTLAPCDSDPTTYTDCKGGDRPTVALVAAPNAAESGTDEDGVPFTEQVVDQYFGTDMLFEYDNRIYDQPETKIAARHGASGSTQTLWFVLRDNRGGVSSTSRTVRVR
jgi:hypothetical protein